MSASFKTRIARIAGLALKTFRLSWALLIRRQPLVSPNGVVAISMATYGGRIRTCYLPILSFIEGSKLTRELVVHLDQGVRLGVFETFVLRRLKKLGVQVVDSQKRGPHTKYFHFLHNGWSEELPLILIDDDVLYDADIIAQLVSAWQSDKTLNYCVRSFLIPVKDGVIQPYMEWSQNISRCSGAHVFATNVGGVLLSPEFCNHVKSRGEEYTRHCSYADDVWFHWVSIDVGINYVQIQSGFKNPALIPFTQGSALWRENLMECRNDRMIEAQYSAEHVEKIVAAWLAVQK